MALSYEAFQIKINAGGMMKNTRSHSEHATHETRKGHHNALNEHHVQPDHVEDHGSEKETGSAGIKKDRADKGNRKDIHAGEHATATAPEHATQNSSHHRGHND